MQNSPASEPSVDSRTRQLKALIAAIERRVAALEAARGGDAASRGAAGARSDGSTPAPRQTSDRAAKLGARFSDLERRVEQLEARAAPTEPGQIERRMLEELQQRGVDAARCVRVPGDYYDRPLEYRRQCLAADSVQQLCKSIVLENTRAPADFPDCGPFERSRYYCVIVQYAARLHTEKLKRYLHKLNGELGIKHFNMRLALGDVSDRLTGFTHNAVTPICMRTRLPIVLSHHITELDHFWLGAGEVDLKAGLPVQQFVAAYAPLVIDCTYDDAPASNANCLSS